MRVSTISALLVLTLAWSGAAAQEAAPACLAGTPSFATTAANRMSCEDTLRLRRSSSAMVLVRRHSQRPNCELRLTRPATDRRDGSFVQFCEVRCRPAGRNRDGFDWRPCGDGSAGRTTGVGSCQNGIWCSASLGMGREGESCGAFHREGDRYAYAWVRGRRSCVDGDISFTPR